MTLLVSRREVTYPSPDITIPSNYTISDPGMISNDSIAHDDTSLQSHTCTDLYTGTNDDIWAKNGGGVDFCGLGCSSAKSLREMRFKAYWVDQDVTSVHPLVLCGIGKQGGVCSGQM